MLEVKRRKGESFDAMLRRFSRKTMQSGRLIQVRKTRYHAKPKSHNASKESALRGNQLREKYEYLQKIGKIDPNARRKRSRRR